MVNRLTEVLLLENYIEKEEEGEEDQYEILKLFLDNGNL